MHRKVLLLNDNYTVLDFISERKAIKLLFKDKVDVLSDWPGVIIFFSSGSINYPAVLRMKYFVNRKFTSIVFSRTMIFKRDRYMCQYCGKHLSARNATMDHIMPKKLGGQTSFLNCITACLTCNAKKGNKLLEDTNMKLLTNPTIPSVHLHSISYDDIWHSEWSLYLKS